MHLSEIVRDSELLPAMFRKEAQERKNQQKKMEEAIEDKMRYQKDHKYLIKKINDLTTDTARKERLAMLT